MSVDKLHKIVDGHLVARTCEYFNPETGKFSEGCGSTLSLSDYGQVICERCEEPQRQIVPETYNGKVSECLQCSHPFSGWVDLDKAYCSDCLKKDSNKKFICDACGKKHKVSLINGSLYMVRGIHMGSRLA